ncbi:MAG: hypothetical protein K0R09_1066 [Clostridiales bacterium]|jgi:hypothetical protein|nr:hypothetical protein [Clostridiales bacterium]
MSFYWEGREYQINEKNANVLDEKANSLLRHWHFY